MTKKQTKTKHSNVSFQNECRCFTLLSQTDIREMDYVFPFNSILHMTSQDGGVFLQHLSCLCALVYNGMGIAPPLHPPPPLLYHFQPYLSRGCLLIFFFFFFFTFTQAGITTVHFQLSGAVLLEVGAKGHFLLSAVMEEFVLLCELSKKIGEM